jgi:nucleotide-binding universal stress UspA family protein
MKNILVLIDLSAGSEQIVRLALKLAKKIDANLILCDVLNTSLHKTALFDSIDHWALEDDEYCDANELAALLKHESGDEENGHITIDCGDFMDFYPEKIRDLIVEKEICMIMLGIRHVKELKTNAPDNYARQLIDHANCPVFLIPDHADVTDLDKIAYLTDLRYCDTHVVNLLKSFNATVFVTHVSAWGTTDMDDAYAQEFLTEEIAANVHYSKLFLRNIKGDNRKTDLDRIALSTGIKAIAIVNKKHQMLDKFIQTEAGKDRYYHKLPLLIMPYMDRNW